MAERLSGPVHATESDTYSSDALTPTQHKHTATCVHAHMNKAKCLYTDETAYKSKGESHETAREHIQVN